MWLFRVTKKARPAGLAESLNNATVKLAEMTGYSKVADLAHNAGIDSVKPTPAMALGAYDATRTLVIGHQGDPIHPFGDADSLAVDMPDAEVE